MDTTKTKIKNRKYKNLMPNTNSSTIKVQKRDGRLEDLDINKIHFVVEEACEGLSGVSSSQIEMNANIQFYDGMTTKDIQNVLVRSANDLISLDYPNYQYAAARLLSYDVRKEAHGQYEYIPLLKLILRNIRLGVYDKGILDKYSKTEIKKLNENLVFRINFIICVTYKLHSCIKFILLTVKFCSFVRRIFCQKFRRYLFDLYVL